MSAGSLTVMGLPGVDHDNGVPGPGDRPGGGSGDGRFPCEPEDAPKLAGDNPGGGNLGERPGGGNDIEPPIRGL